MLKNRISSNLVIEWINVLAKRRKRPAGYIGVSTHKSGFLLETDLTSSNVWGKEILCPPVLKLWKSLTENHLPRETNCAQVSLSCWNKCVGLSLNRQPLLSWSQTRRTTVKVGSLKSRDQSMGGITAVSSLFFPILFLELSRNKFKFSF